MEWIYCSWSSRQARLGRAYYEDIRPFIRLSLSWRLRADIAMTLLQICKRCWPTVGFSDCLSAIKLDEILRCSRYLNLITKIWLVKYFRAFVRYCSNIGRDWSRWECEEYTSLTWHYAAHLLINSKQTVDHVGIFRCKVFSDWLILSKLPMADDVVCRWRNDHESFYKSVLKWKHSLTLTRDNTKWNF